MDLHFPFSLSCPLRVVIRVGSSKPSAPPVCPGLAFGGVLFLLRGRLHHANQIRTANSPIPTTPPMVPPTIAPIFFLGTPVDDPLEIPFVFANSDASFGFEKPPTGCVSRAVPFALDRQSISAMFHHFVIRT
jgi:hypothetical protein